MTASADRLRKESEDEVLPHKKSRPFLMLLGMMAHHKGVFAVAVVLGVVSSLLGLAQPLLINELIARVGVAPLAGLVALLIGTVLLMAVVEGVQIYLITRTAEAAVRDTRIRLIRRMLRLPMNVYDRMRSGDLVTRLGSDTTLVRTAFTGGLVDAISGVFTVVGAIILMALLDWLMLLIVFVVIVIALLVVLTASSHIQTYTTRAQKAVGDLGAGMDRALAAIRTVRSANAQDRVESELTADAHRAWRHGERMARIEGSLWPATDVAVQVAFLAVLGVGGIRVATGSISVGDLVAFVMYMFLLAMPIGQAFGAVTTVRQAMGALQRITQVLDQPEETTAGATAAPARDITFDNVSFSYPGTSTQRPVLDGVSFHVPAGSTTALVGPSGSGKSTSLALIQRFYDVDEGTILLGDQDIAGLSPVSVRELVGTVEQDAAVLAGTVRDNLRLANPEVSDDECWAVLEQVRLSQRFREADGLDTVLGDRGVSLSGGQKQRLALARMLLMETPILMLDEPTSAVDSHNEQAIMDAITSSAKGRTLLIIAHRLSTVTDADQIVVIDDGRAVDSGTHEQLLESSPLYRDLATRQLLV